MAKKDYNLPKHPDIDVKNLFVRPTGQDDTLREILTMRRLSRLANLSLPEDT